MKQRARKLRKNQTASGITFVSAIVSDIIENDGSTTINNLTSGDFLLLIASQNRGGAIELTGTNLTNVWQVNASMESTVSYTFATGSSYTVTSDESCSLVGVVLRGVNTTTPLDSTPTTPSDTGNISSITPPSVTTTVDGCMVLPILIVEDEPALASLTQPTGYNTALNAYFETGEVYHVINYKTVASAGTESPSQYNWDNGDRDEVHCSTIAIRPAS